MNLKKKKGFTIVELVIVIAVIGILAAVLIPTFANLINKAHQSADIQAVRQMNTLLAMHTDGSIDTVADAVKILDQDNIDLDNYKPLQSNHYFYFVVDSDGTPKIIYADAEDNIIFPEKIEPSVEGLQWMSLSGSVPEDGDYTVNTEVTEKTASVEINSGAKFVHFMNHKLADLYVDASVETIDITLTDDIDMRGASASFGKVDKNVTLNAANKRISGLRVDRNTTMGVYQGQEKSYGYALFNQVSNGITVKVSDLNLTDFVVKDTTGKPFGQSGVLFGSVYGAVEINHVTVDRCVVYGADKVGSLIGYLTGRADLKNVTVTNTNVCGVGFVAKAIGCIGEAAKVSFENVNCDGVTTAVNKDAWGAIWNSKDINWLTGEPVKIEEVKAYLSGKTGNTYIPWQKKVKQLQGITTTDLYWVDNKTDNDDGSIKEAYKTSVNGTECGYQLSGNENRN